MNRCFYITQTQDFKQEKRFILFIFITLNLLSSNSYTVLKTKLASKFLFL